MAFATLNVPLTEAEKDRLQALLDQRKDAMNFEKLDGFFAALIAGPEVILPSEYLPEVFGGNGHLGEEFRSLADVQEFLSLMMRHWNRIAATLAEDQPYVPVLLEDDDGVTHANDWADGFVQGMEMRRPGWQILLDDDDHAGCVVPMLMLHHEHDEDPEMRPPAIDQKTREEIIVQMASGLLLAYRYFRKRMSAAGMAAGGRPTERIGRNAPCPCGSGKRYKRCCGAQ